MARVDYEKIGSNYETGRGLDLGALDGWRVAVAPYVRGGARVVDVGAGTGVFAEAFARWFDAQVVGIEPAQAMRREAISAHAHPRVSYTGGDAEHLPLRDASCDAAWLSTVVHHIPDLEAAARELRRVLRPDAPVLIRGAFPGRCGDITLFRYFPGGLRIIDTYPNVEGVAAVFGGAGFRVVEVRSVPQVSAPSLHAYLERVRLRADTVLTLISDEDFQAGIAEIAHVADEEMEPSPIIDRLDLLVLR